jgi:hypothetical protein
MEIESDSVFAFLDALVIREELTLATKVYRKPTHTSQYLYFNSNHTSVRVFTIELPPYAMNKI